LRLAKDQINSLSRAVKLLPVLQHVPFRNGSNHEPLLLLAEVLRLCYPLAKRAFVEGLNLCPRSNRPAFAFDESLQILLIHNSNT